MFATVLCTVNLKSCCNRKSRQQNLMQVGRRFLFCKCWGHWHCHYLQIPCNLFSRLSACVADTFWSVHIKFCFHQKKAQSKRATTRIRPAERQHKGRDQSNTKNVTSKTPRLHNVAKQHKVSDRSVWNPKTNCIQAKSNKIWFRKAKSEERRKEANRAEEDLKSWCHGKVQKTLH